MAPQLKLSELYRLQDQKKTNKFVAFDRILEICHNKIRNTARVGGLSIFYEIPGMMLGYPLYDIGECADYVIGALRKSGLLVQVLPAPHVGVIYISWNPLELKPVAPPKALLPAQPQSHYISTGAGAPVATVQKKKKLVLF